MRIGANSHIGATSTEVAPLFIIWTERSGFVIIPDFLSLTNGLKSARKSLDTMGKSAIAARQVMDQSKFITYLTDITKIPK